MADLLSRAVDIIWGPWTFFILLGMGVAATIGTRFIQTTILTEGVRVARGTYDNGEHPGAISHFQALSAALSATVGLGNIGGVALAMSFGGPGALFWMWVVAVFGMALKAVEITVAVQFRDTSNPDAPRGGSMWVIRETLGRSRWPLAALAAAALGGVFAVTNVVSTFTGGNVFQVWNVSNLLRGYFGIPELVTSVGFALLVGLVVLGGIRRIGVVASRLVPFMCVVYLAAALVVLAMNVEAIPRMLRLVVSSALSPTEGAGAFLGAGMYYAFTIGMRRALFSNEAGQGTAPMVHAAARTNEPAREGIVGGLGPFIDTLVICTLTALVILTTGVWDREGEGDLRTAPTLVAHLDDATGLPVWRAEQPLDALDNLPQRSRRAWDEGTPLYLVARSDGQRAAGHGGHDRLALHGALERDATTGRLVIAFTPITVDPRQWVRTPTAIHLDSLAVHERYDGAELTALAFDRAMPGYGRWLVALAAWLFALSTIISYSFYGEQGMVYLVGERGVTPFRIVYIAATAAAPLLVTDVELLLLVIDFGTGSMLWANIPILLLTGWLGVRALNSYRSRLRAGAFDRPGLQPPPDA